jgi:hypothetical protein
MTHPLYTPSTARSPKVISFEPLQRGADAAEAAIRAAEDQLVRPSCVPVRVREPSVGVSRALHFGDVTFVR